MRLGFIIINQRIKLRGPGSRGQGSSRFQTKPSAGKVMATVFWDAKGIIMLDFLPKANSVRQVFVDQKPYLKLQFIFILPRYSKASILPISKVATATLWLIRTRFAIKNPI